MDPLHRISVLESEVLPVWVHNPIITVVVVVVPLGDIEKGLTGHGNDLKLNFPQNRSEH